MLASGNSDIMTCISNLFSLRRGECAYERVKGIDQDIIDENIMSAEIDLLEDAEFVVDQYEPRVSIDSMNIDPVISNDGLYSINFDLTDSEDDSDDVEE